MEILRTADYSPHRLHAIVRLVPKLSHPRQSEILDLVQPPDLIGKNRDGKIDQKTSSDLLNIAEMLELLQKGEDGETYSLHDNLIGQRVHIDKIDFFRSIMQNCVSNADSVHNKKFRRITAWYAVQDERIFSYPTKAALAKQYTDELSDRDTTDILEEGREFNDTQYNGWLEWVAFLGWGWKMKLDIDLLIPNCAVRLKPLLMELLPNQNKEILMTDFMERVSQKCVELDGGVEYDRCWSSSRPNDQRTNQLSLMLSSGLRTLESQKLIKLIYYDDSPEMWRLYPAETFQINVSHIKRIKGKIK